MLGWLGKSESVRRAVAIGAAASMVTLGLLGGCGSPNDAPYVPATCAGVCSCLGAACPDYPFAPDCMTACQDPTHPAWDLSCRAAECSAAYSAHDAHCPNASGQTKCQ